MQRFIYYYKKFYMFRASICPSSGVLGCTRCILLHMLFNTIKENCVLVDGFILCCSLCCVIVV
jgi:hypothetical protein